MRFKCKNCRHTIINGKFTKYKFPLMHKNIGQKPAFICRVKRCNCLNPELKENENESKLK